MKKTVCGVFAAVAALAVADAARAQVCAGFPTHDGQASVSAFANFPSGFDQYGGEASYNFNGPLAVNGGFIYSTGDGDNLNTFRAGAALDISSATATIAPGLSVCPNVRADFTSENGTDLIQVPIGLGLGATLPVGGPGMSLTPYVIPALVWSRFDDDVLGSDTETNFGIRGGADLNFDQFFLGGMVEWVDGNNTDAVFGVRAGIKL